MFPRHLIHVPHFQATVGAAFVGRTLDELACNSSMAFVAGRDDRLVELPRRDACTYKGGVFP